MKDLSGWIGLCKFLLHLPLFCFFSRDADVLIDHVRVAVEEESKLNRSSKTAPWKMNIAEVLGLDFCILFSDILQNRSSMSVRNK